MHPEQQVSYARNKSDVILNIPDAILEIHPIEENCIIKRKASADQTQIFLDLNSTEIIKQLGVLFALFLLPHFNVINVYSISKDFNQDLINENQNL